MYFTTTSSPPAGTPVTRTPSTHIRSRLLSDLITWETRVVFILSFASIQETSLSKYHPPTPEEDQSAGASNGFDPMMSAEYEFFLFKEDSQLGEG